MHSNKYYLEIELKHNIPTDVVGQITDLKLHSLPLKKMAGLLRYVV